MRNPGTRWLTSLWVVWLFSAGSVSIEAEVRAADQANSPQLAAEHFVASALQAEADGDFLARQQLLQSAQSCQPDCAALKWQQGYVEVGGKWFSIDEFIEAAEANKALGEYESRRLQLQDSLPNHFKMAQWCLSQGLLPQARAHYERVLQFDSEHAAARAALGYQLFEGEWVSSQEIARLLAKAEAAKASLSKYGKPLQQIARDMISRDKEKQREGKYALMALTQADSIPAVEITFRQADEQISLAVISWLGQQDNVAGSLALLNYACHHSRPTVRMAATAALKQRPLHDFVPELLGMLNSPISTMTVPTFNDDGTLAGYQQSFAQEGHQRTNLLTISAQVTRSPQALPIDASQLPPGTPTVEIRRGSPIDWRNAFSITMVRENQQIEQAVLRTSEAETRSRTVLAQQRNVAIAQQNRRVQELLTLIAGREFSDDPHQAWQWWDEINETGYQRSKPLRYRQEQLGITVPRVYRPELVMPVHECFVAGTQVLTTRGPKPIESIVAGDTVFTRELESGALLIKPVLQATRQPAAPTIEIEADQDCLRCTMGHLFWVSGHGWKKASELKAGDTLHAAEHPCVVASVKPAPSQVTFNLQVADCGTYFVGSSHVLSHDALPRGANHQLVPGLK